MSTASISQENCELASLLKEIEALECKKQGLLKALSQFSSNFSEKPPAKPINLAISSQIARKPAKTQPQSREDLLNSLTNKSEAGSKPSHLYQALAKYLFFEHNSCDLELEVAEISEKSQKKPFDCDSFDSFSTKDNFSVTNSEKASFSRLFCRNSEFLKEFPQFSQPLSQISQQQTQDRRPEASKFLNKQLKNRDIASQKLKRRPRARFTLLEDQKILSMIEKIGQNWHEIAKSLPGRTEGMVKNRFYSHIKRKYTNISCNKACKTAISCEETSKTVDFVQKEQENRREMLNFEEMVNEMQQENRENGCRELGEAAKNGNFLAFFEENHRNCRDFDVEEDFSWNLMKTPDISYNFDDYRNNLLKLTPEPEENMVKVEEFDEIRENLEECVESHAVCNKSKIKDLSHKIGDIELLLNQTKQQISKLYSFN